MQDAKELTLDVLREGLVPSLISSPGIGKSAIAKEIADEQNGKLIDIRLSQMDPTDLQGLPFGNKERTKAGYLPMDLFPLEGDELPVKTWKTVDGVQVPDTYYKGWLILMDEFNCFSLENQVLTEKGWMDFDVAQQQPELQIAQYDMNTRKIDFALPLQAVAQDYSGDLYDMDGSYLNFAMTGNHNLVVHRTTAGRVTEKTFKVPVSQVVKANYTKLPVCGYASGSATPLSTQEKLAIAFQADGSVSHTNADKDTPVNQHTNTTHPPENISISFGFKRQTKIAAFRARFPQIQKTTYPSKPGQTHFILTNQNPVQLTKDFSQFNLLNFNATKAEEFIQEVLVWDGFKTPTGFGYSNTCKAAVDFVQQLGVLAGYRANVMKVIDPREDTYNVIWKLHLHKMQTVSAQSLTHMTQKPYTGKVYCYHMPKGTVITRRKGKVLISGNSAPLLVQAAAYKVVLDKMVGMAHLHKNCAIIVAGNLATDKAIVNRTSTAMQSRLIWLEIMVSLKAFIKWADKNDIDHRIKSFLQFKPDALHKFNPNHEEHTFPCPRTWEFMSKLIRRHKELSITKLPLLAGTVGEGTAREFFSYCGVYKEIPTIKDIMINPTKVRFGDEPSIAYALAGLIPHHINEQNINTLMQFVERLPIDFQVIALRASIAKDRKLKNAKSVKAWLSLNARELVS